MHASTFCDRPGLHQGTAGADPDSIFSMNFNRVDAGGDVSWLYQNTYEDPSATRSFKKIVTTSILIVIGTFTTQGMVPIMRPCDRNAGTHKLAVMINGQAIRGLRFRFNAWLDPRGPGHTAAFCPGSRLQPFMYWQDSLLMSVTSMVISAWRTSTCLYYPANLI